MPRPAARPAAHELCGSGLWRPAPGGPLTPRNGPGPCFSAVLRGTDG